MLPEIYDRGALTARGHGDAARPLVDAGLLGLHGQADEGELRRDPLRPERPRRRVRRVRDQRRVVGRCSRASPGDRRHAGGVAGDMDRVVALRVRCRPHRHGRRARNLPTDDPLRHIVTDSRRIRVDSVNDHLWVAPLDAAARCSSARTYAVPGRVVIEVQRARRHVDHGCDRRRPPTVRVARRPPTPPISCAMPRCSACARWAGTAGASWPAAGRVDVRRADALLLADAMFLDRRRAPALLVLDCLRRSALSSSRSRRR